MTAEGPDNIIPDSNQKLAGEISEMVKKYLTEVNSPATPEEFFNDLSIVPIKWQGEIKGFWGLIIRKNRQGILAAVKAVYVVPEARGKYLNAFADILIEGLAEKGVTHLEIWAFPHVEEWLRRRYNFTPRISIIQAPIDSFFIYDRKALREELKK